MWHRETPHIQTLGTAMNDQYAGPDIRAGLMETFEASHPPICAIGIIDYSELTFMSRSSTKTAVDVYLT